MASACLVRVRARVRVMARVRARVRVEPQPVHTGQLRSHAAGRPPRLSALPPLASLPLRQQHGKLRHLARVRVEG